jgi:DNA ligase-1
VYKRLIGLSKVKGAQSGRVKGDVVRKLMVQARGEEMRFLVRSLIGNLRVSQIPGRNADTRSEQYDWYVAVRILLRQTLLTALARATALFHLPAELADEVKPIPQAPPKAEKGQKRITKPKVEPDPAREEVEERLVAATKLVRKVYVRHPNYGDLVKGIEDGGLVGLEDRVPVSVGEWNLKIKLSTRYSPFSHARVDHSVLGRGVHTSGHAAVHR